MLEEILKKETIDESDFKVLVANLHLLSESDLIRFGFKQPEIELPTIQIEEKIKKVISKPKTK